VTDIPANLPEGTEPGDPAWQRPAALLPPVNTGLAIAAFISVWFVPLLGAILGHVDNADARRSGRAKAGLAMAAVIIGWIGTALGLLLAILVISALARAGQSAPDPYATGF
jgi:uncharacterized protein YacL